MTYPFPSAPTDLKLSEVLGSYGQTSLINLVGNTYWTLNVNNTSTPTPIVIPITLSNFRGKYYFDPAAQTFSITSNTVPLPPFTAQFFSLDLVGQGGGGGGAGGDYNGLGFFAGGEGCGGGGGAYLVTTKIPYTTNTFSVPNLPTGGGTAGNGGFGGNNTQDGFAGGAGSNATIVYAGLTYSAGGGAGGNGGFRGQFGQGGANANQPVAGGSVSGPNIATSAGGANGVVRSGGNNGKGLSSGGLGGAGGNGAAGTDGYASITWFVE
jgi:hypothetical protein